MRFKGLLAIPVLLLIANGVQPSLLAQEPSEPPTEQEAPQAEAPAEDPGDAPAEAPAEPVPGEEQPEKKKMPIGLWIYAAYGTASAKDVNSSISTSVESDSENTVTLDDWDSVRAELGWKLPNEKGMFLVRFNGYKESNYEFTAIGRQASLKPPLSATTILENLDVRRQLIGDDLALGVQGFNQDLLTCRAGGLAAPACEV